MPKIFGKVFISFLAFIVLFLSFAPAAMAQTNSGASSVANSVVQASPGPWYSQNFIQWYSKVYNNDNPNEIFGERYTAAQVQWVFYSVLAFLINLATGNNPAATGCIMAAGNGNTTSCTQSIFDSLKSINSSFGTQSSGANNKTSLLQMMFQDRNLSGITYVKDIFRKFKIIPTANAQTPTGFGYSQALGAIPDIQSAWATVRDISYVFFVAVMIVFAFMIMFRMKISPQVVVTVQSALPKIVIGLILVTFSYAIAGFLIDMLYVVIGILALVFSRFTVAGVGFFVGGGNPVAGYFAMLTTGPTFLGIQTGIFGLMVMYIVNYFLIAIYVVFGGLIAGALGNQGLGAVGLFIVILFIALLGLIIVLIMALINFFRVIILLARAFVTVLLLTIFAPLQLAAGTFMNGLGFGAWIRSLVSNLAIFPTVGSLFIIALWFLQLSASVIRNAPAYVTNGPFSNGWPPLLGGSPQMLSLAYLLASIAVFLMIPSAGKLVQGIMSGKFAAPGAKELAGFAIGAGAGIGAQRVAQMEKAAPSGQTAFTAALRSANRYQATSEYLLSELARRLGGGR